MKKQSTKGEKIKFTCLECGHERFNLVLGKDEILATCSKCKDVLCAFGLEPEMLKVMIEEELKNL